MSKKKCKSNCIYFPQIDVCVDYYIDQYGVKHRINSQPYICTYTGHAINVKHRCSYKKTIESIKEKMKQTIEGSE